MFSAEDIGMTAEEVLESPWPRNPFLKGFCVGWALLNLVLGMLCLIGVVSIGNWMSIKVRNGAFDILVKGWLARKLAKGWGGFTLGACIFYWDLTSYNDPKTQCHERVHVRQALLWGFMQLVLYLVFLLFCGYENNNFEKQARSVEEKLK